MFQKALPIWLANSRASENEYGDFVLSFSLPSLDGDFLLSIAAASEYEVFLNGKRIGFGQYPHFTDEKFVDEYPVNEFLLQGENTLFVTALSRDYPTASQIKSGKWVAFEITRGEESVCHSSPDVLSRQNPHYHSGKIPFITSQIGMGYRYSFTGKETALEPSKDVPAFFKYSPRPVRKLDVSTFVPFGKIGPNLYGAGKEVVGYLEFEIKSDIDQDLLVAFGEHITDHRVRRNIGARDFSLSFELKKGVNRFFSPFFRLGLRYLELSPFEGEVLRLGVVQAKYPHEVIPFDYGDLNPIAEKSLYTVECCMHEHYEDCPWREAAQYTMDSRIEMLVSMLYFRNFEFSRACLRQMAHDLTDLGTLRITTPSESELSIPIYSLIFPRMILEYGEFSQDESLAEEFLPTILSLLSHYRGEMVDGLLPHLNEWNFYEWAPGLHFEEEIFSRAKDDGQFDLILNAFYLIALDSTAQLMTRLHQDYTDLRNEAETMRRKVHDRFLSPDGLFYSFYREGGYHYSELANYLALWTGIATKEERKGILDRLMKPNDLVPMTLCHYIFKYEVLLSEGDYEEFILDDIKRVWGWMDVRGATTYWETIRGQADFSGAGSLCHGWSAVPAYILFRIFKNNVKKGGSNE